MEELFLGTNEVEAYLKHKEQQSEIGRCIDPCQCLLAYAMAYTYPTCTDIVVDADRITARQGSSRVVVHLSAKLQRMQHIFDVYSGAQPGEGVTKIAYLNAYRAFFPKEKIA